MKLASCFQYVAPMVFGIISEATNIKNYSINYKNVPLKIKDVAVIASDRIKINLENNPLGIRSNKDIKKHLKYEIYNLKDIYDRELNIEEVLNVFQFREFFVQEVFINKELPENLEFVKKVKNLSKSEINKLDKASRYWVNTPLKEIKERI